MLRQLRNAATAAIISAAVLTGCGDDGITLPDERAAAAIDISAGDAQEATVGTALPLPVRALVTDAQGSPVANQRVDFTASGGGAAAPASTQTDANGVASTEWTLGTTAGSQTLTADQSSLLSVEGLQLSPVPGIEPILTTHGTAFELSLAFTVGLEL